MLRSKSLISLHEQGRGKNIFQIARGTGFPEIPSAISFVIKTCLLKAKAWFETRPVQAKAGRVDVARDFQFVKCCSNGSAAKVMHVKTLVKDYVQPRRRRVNMPPRSSGCELAIPCNKCSVRAKTGAIYYLLPHKTISYRNCLRKEFL